MELTSPEFSSGGALPPKYTADGEDECPTLQISGVPRGAESLALIMGNPEARSGFRTHWLTWNIPPDATRVPDETCGREKVGQNDFGTVGYTGPRPEKGPTTCPYVFYLYAVDREVETPDGGSMEELWGQIGNHVVEKTELRTHYCAQSPGKR